MPGSPLPIIMQPDSSQPSRQAAWQSQPHHQAAWQTPTQLSCSLADPNPIIMQPGNLLELKQEDSSTAVKELNPITRGGGTKCPD